MYVDTVTVFNRYNGTWKGVVLYNVDLNTDKAMMLKTYGENSQDRSKLHIKYKVKNGVCYIGEYRYVEQREYTGENGTITFQEGNNMSFFMKGTAPIFTANDSDYLDGFFDYMNANYDVYAISSCAKYSVIPHFEILGR